MDVDLNGSGGSHHNNEEGGGGRHSALTEDFLSHFTSAAAGGSGGGGGSSGASNVNAAVAATLANLVANNNNSIHHRNNGSSTKLDDSSRISEAVSRIASSMQTPQSSISGTSKKTQCPECGKHMRKPKDLVTHLTTIHRYSPDDIANVTGNLNLMTSTSESLIIIPSSLSTTLNTTTSSSSGGGGGADTSGISDYGRSALTTELKQIQKTLNELKSQRNV
uniref:C2H2-type domain-containing protein n=1 Tax=Panagrolaimus sp. PS1159 TaxID=55785 RepID=A0AC35GWW0_9BILA